MEQLFGEKNQLWCGISHGRYVYFDRIINLVSDSQIIEHKLFHHTHNRRNNCFRIHTNSCKLAYRNFWKHWLGQTYNSW